MRLYYNLNSQDTGGNTSNVTVYATVQRNDGYAASAYNGYENQNTATLTVGGVQRVNRHFVLDTRNSRVQELSRWTGNLTHNADGSLTAALAAGFSTSLAPSLTGGSLSASWTLPAIPRKSSFTVSPSSVAVGGSLTVTVQPASSSFSHRATLSFGTRSATVSFSAGETKKSLAVPSEWLNALPSSTSGAASLTVTTYSGSASVGTSSQSVTLTVGPNVQPTAGTLSISRIDGAVPAGWGVYVQGYSKAALTLSGSKAGTGSSISSYKLACGSYTSSSASLTTGFLSTAGTVGCTGQVTDARGRSASTSGSIRVEPYSPPKFSGVRVYRSDPQGGDDPTGDCLAIEAGFTFASVAGKNACTASYKAWPVGSPSAYVSGTFESGTRVILPDIGQESSWEVTLTLADALTSSVYSAAVSSAFVTMDFLHGGKGVSIGKIAEYENLFECGMDAAFHGALSVGGAALADFVVEQGTSGIWQYRKWKGGTAECWGIGTLTDITSISGRGTYFYSTPVSIAYPDGLFTGRVVPHVALNPSTAFTVPSYTDFGAVAANFYILTPNEARTSFTVNYAIYAVGRWK